MNPFRTHEVVVAWIHIFVALFVCSCVLIIWIGSALLAPTFEGTFIPGLVAMFGRPVAAFLLILACVEAAAATALLRGHFWARTTLVVVSVFQLPIFPIGTAIAAYTMWVLLRKEPPSSIAAINHEARA